jgi:hypothetical protein
MFHASLITPYIKTPSHRSNFTRPPPNLIDGKEEYKVEQICSHQRWGCHKTLQYLIKWKGYPESDNIWENANQIHTPILIKLYHRTNALEATKAHCIQFKYQHPPLLPLKTHSSLATPSSTIILPSTATLVWTGKSQRNNQVGMQFPSPPSSPMSTGSTALYYAARVLCNTNGTPVNLADLYHHQQQLAIHSMPPRT